jgi:Zn-dependent peptidase ImmA (M78 family)
MSQAIMTPAEVLKIYWTGDIPVDVRAVADKIGIEVITTEELSQQGLSGKIEFKEQPRKNPVIYVNAQESEARQRFTIAHELGHYFCGHSDSCREDPAFNLSPAVGLYEERQANEFAANLLMPKIALEYLIYEKKEFNIENLAAIFEVSPLAIHFRLKNLGFIK